MKKYYTVIFEGIDKTGKDQLARYVDEICGHDMCLPRRGIVSNVAYAKLYGREAPEYDLSNHKHEIYVLLRCSDKTDWKMRCKLTNEPAIDYEKNVEVFETTWDWFKTVHDPKLCFEYDTCKMTPIQIARDIVGRVNMLNSNN